MDGQCGLDEVAVFDSVKNITTLYNSGTPTDLTAVAGLIGYWRMEEGIGTTTTDSSINSNTGTLTTANIGLPTWDTDVPG